MGAEGSLTIYLFPTRGQRKALRTFLKYFPEFTHKITWGPVRESRLLYDDYWQRGGPEHRKISLPLPGTRQLWDMAQVATIEMENYKDIKTFYSLLAIRNRCRQVKDVTLTDITAQSLIIYHIYGCHESVYNHDDFKDLLETMKQKLIPESTSRVRKQLLNVVRIIEEVLIGSEYVEVWS